ncbi:MarR family transcriptional regulator [Corynebacterium sp. zg-331]|uniref:MarR family transcriptional regulator n=1 Tax=unclassified Corynebacterium TaxID=2624378 RepID=UPI00128BF65D|nr:MULTISPECIES: MarR family transcriptional regulator [unclassified Corynebacterium]MBC3185545.1 MarR family transcriptional regulator [Corynebacterium sp. zg-331]MPV52039.1 MarR family transcriptional regulator [Corynebacterium sp. zg331]
MFALHARYRGRATRRADLVERSAQALGTLEGVGPFRSLGVEDIRADIATPEALCNVVMALLSDGDWAIGVGLGEAAAREATGSLSRAARSGTVSVGAASGVRGAEEVAAVFALLGQVLSKRTVEGRQATALVRGGLSQNEAAAELGISKQAMSQRLQAAGWQAENAGWGLAVALLRRAVG